MGRLIKMKNGLIVDPDGIKIYYKDDQYHREDGPAIEWPDGDKQWYFEGKLHREDGPAIVWTDGGSGFYLMGKYYSEDRYNEAMLENKLKLLGL
jgi:hypothetical protein